MKKLIFGFMIFVGANCFAQSGGTTIGSGGDALRQLFFDAKGAAASKVEQLNVCAFDSTATAGARDWLLKNQAALALDLRLSAHAWVVDGQSTCGFTNHSPQSTVYLSYPTCASTAHGLNEAIFVLIHESAHHLGVDDERAADEIARAALYASYVPNCSMGQGVFDPNICSSAPMGTDDARRYFKPGDVQAVIGKYNFYAQISRCVALSGCEPTKPWVIESAVLERGGHNVIDMQLVLTAQEKTPFFSTQFIVVTDVAGWIVTSGTDPQHFLRDVNPTHPNSVTLSGSAYRPTDSATKVYLDTDPVDFRFRRDCIWSKWTRTYDRGNGAQDKVEIVLYGTH